MRVTCFFMQGCSESPQLFQLLARQLCEFADRPFRKNRFCNCGATIAEMGLNIFVANFDAVTAFVMQPTVLTAGTESASLTRVH